jgi:hypothetical protein
MEYLEKDNQGGTVELVRLAAEEELAVSQSNRSEVAYALASMSLCLESNSTFVTANCES